MDDASPSHWVWSSVPVEPVLPGITRQVVHGERQSMVRYVYQPGSVFPLHRHPEEQITLVVAGRIAFEIDGRHLELGPGEVAVIPANMAHGARALGEGAVETYNALSPRRAASPVVVSTEADIRG